MVSIRKTYASEVTVNVRLNRDVDQNNDVGNPWITSEVRQNKETRVDGADGQYTDIIHHNLGVFDNQFTYVISNDDDLAVFENYEEAKTELIDRLCSSFRQYLTEAITIEGLRDYD